MEKESYIEQLFNSTDGITKVRPNDDLLSRIQMRIQEENRFSSKTMWLVAASIVILATINVSVILKSNDNPKNRIEKAMASTLDKSNQLY